jgi:LuxR family maltose regulon positive regulatory protein
VEGTGGSSGNGELTERELVVLRLLTGPLSENDIARELYVSRNTVHSQTRSIYRKLGVSSRAAAIAAAHACGLI